MLNEIKSEIKVAVANLAVAGGKILKDEVAKARGVDGVYYSGVLSERLGFKNIEKEEILDEYLNGVIIEIIDGKTEIIVETGETYPPRYTEAEFFEILLERLFRNTVKEAISEILIDVNKYLRR